jgi:hypothetical protein
LALASFFGLMGGGGNAMGNAAQENARRLSTFFGHFRLMFCEWETVFFVVSLVFSLLDAIEREWGNELF